MALTKVTGHVVLPTTNIEFHNTKSTGIVTFTDTTQSTSATTGGLQIAGGVGIVKNLNVGGNLNVTGNISYTDVDNINSVGIITANAGVILKHSASGKFGQLNSNAAGAVVIKSDPNNNADNSSIQFHVDGSEKARITGIGSVGIGTNAPTKLLEIYQADNRKHQFSYDDNLLTIKGANNNGNPENLRFIGDDLRFNTGTSGSGTEYFRITDTGEVKIMNTSGTVGLYFQSSSGAVSNFRAIGTNLQSLGYFFGNDEKIRFASDGTVGIGTNNPGNFNAAADNLVVGTGVGHNGITVNSAADGDGWLVFNDAPNNNLTGSIQYNHVDNYMEFRTNTSPRLRIDTSGRVIIGGGATPTQVGDGRLIVYADTRLHPGIKVDCLQGGSNTANGFTLLADNYQADESIVNFGVSYSGSALVLSRGVKVSNTADNAYISSYDTGSTKPTALRLDGAGNLIFLNTNTSATTTTDSAVSLSERFRIDATGQITNTGIETSFVTTMFAANFAKLDIRGTNISNSNHYILSYGAGHDNNQEFHMVNTIGEIVFRTGSGSNTDRLRIDTSGRISNNSREATDFGSPNLLISGTNSMFTMMGDGSINNSSYTGIKFRVAGASTGDYTKAGIFVVRQGGYNDLDMLFCFNKDANATGVSDGDEKVRINSDGRVGINTTLMEMAGVTGNLNIANNNFNNHTVINLSRNTTSDRPQIRFQDPNGNVGYIGTYDSDLTISSGNDLIFRASSTDKLRITSDGDVAIGRDSAQANYADASTTDTTRLAVVKQSAGSGYHEMAHFAAGSDANDTGSIVRIGHFSNDRGFFVKAGRGTSDQAKAIFGLRTSSAADQDIMTFLQGGQVLIGTTTVPSNSNTPLRIHTSINSSSANSLEITHSTNGAHKLGAAIGIAVQNGGESTNTADLKFATANNGSTSTKMTLSAGGILRHHISKNTTAIEITTHGDGAHSFGDEARMDFLMRNEVPQSTGNPAARIASYLQRGNNGYGLRFYARTNASTLFKAMEMTADYQVLPGVDGVQDLGSTSYRWKDVYTSDLDLSNETKGGNSIDGTWGSYKIEEGEDDLFIINRRNGKKYKFNLTEIS